MTGVLRQYFPELKERSEIFTIIQENERLKSVFDGWEKESQEEFLDFCSGSKGVKILYDSFFKEVFNPEYAPSRLNFFLSVILNRQVKIIQILPVDSTRIGEETSLVTMDIVVELDDGSIVNVEIQKVGYLFPGERSACYSSDLLLRQYKRIREKPGKFSYKEIKPVYTIVLFEKSPFYFKDFPEDFIHRFEQCSNTGLKIELLQKYIFISLDIFKNVRQNIENELDAWLTFLGSDEPEDIADIIDQYPEFKPMYDTIFALCKNVEGVMDMFSEELYILDRNTEKLMIDEYNRIAEELRQEIRSQEEQLKIHKEQVKAQEEQVKAQEEQVKAQEEQMKAQEEQMKAQEEQMKAQEERLLEQESIIAEKDKVIERLYKQLNKLD